MSSKIETDPTWWEKNIGSMPSLVSGGEVAEVEAPPGESFGKKIMDAAREVEEAARMVALRRSLVIGLVILLAAALMKSLKVSNMASILAVVGLVVIVQAIAQYVI